MQVHAIEEDDVLFVDCGNYDDDNNFSLTNENGKHSVVSFKVYLETATSRLRGIEVQSVPVWDGISIAQFLTYAYQNLDPW